jgi:hypothetical protein
MLTNATFLTDLTIHATDGEIGSVKEFYFDDETWGIRYLVVKTGGWFSGKEVLISPISIKTVDWTAKLAYVGLTMKQVENSPGMETHKPISRQYEAEYSSYYGYNNYWGGPYLWGPGYYPAYLAIPPTAWSKARIHAESMDSHLRSSQAVTGYHVEAKDGEIGHVDGFVIDDQYWSVRYVEVATRNWLPGKKVLVSPAWIDRVSWLESKIFMSLFRQAIEDAPEYLLDRPISREYENKLYFHYGRPPYWEGESERTSAYSLTGV